MIDSHLAIAMRLRHLHAEMTDTALMLARQPGDESLRHAAELAGAAGVVGRWAEVWEGMATADGGRA